MPLTLTCYLFFQQRSYTAAGAPNLDDVLLISSKKISVRESSNLQ